MATTIQKNKKIKKSPNRIALPVPLTVRLNKKVRYRSRTGYKKTEKKIITLGPVTGSARNFHSQSITPLRLQCHKSGSSYWSRK